jgi:two-component system chemotaxis response regulator CheB
MTDVLSSDPEIEVVGASGDPYLAAKKMKEVVPDVITLDVEMPRMDGITFLRKLMSQHPIPVVMSSSLAENGSETALKALEYGAVDIIQKPKIGVKQFLEESKILVCDAVRAAVQARKRKGSTPSFHVAPKLTADVVLSKPTSRAMVETTERVVVVGASTGGTEALRDLLEALPQDAPGMVIVQHMPENFTRAFANRLNGLCRVSVREAELR